MSRQDLSTMLRAAIATAGYQSTYAAAKAMALEQADRDGYPGLAVERVEDITA